MITAVVSVLYGNETLPSPVAELAAMDEAQVIVVDNSGDLSMGAPVGGIEVLTPARNLGYARGVNLAISHVNRDSDVVLLLNPDVHASGTTLIELARRSHGYADRAAILAPHSKDGSFGWQPRATVSATIYGHLVRRPYIVQSNPCGFLSGALLAINRAALDALVGNQGLLQPDLFFMDDVELCDRARGLGVVLEEIRSSGPIAHVGSESIRKRPAVGIYFSRVSKVRYWSRERPHAANLIRAVFLAEATVGWIVASAQERARKKRLRYGKAEGFASLLRWLLTQDDGIDYRVLG